jgi:hypothetical protein
VTTTKSITPNQHQPDPFSQTDKPAHDLPGQGVYVSRLSLDHLGLDHAGLDHAGLDHAGLDHLGLDNAELSPRECLYQLAASPTAKMTGEKTQAGGTNRPGAAGKES